MISSVDMIPPAERAAIGLDERLADLAETALDLVPDTPDLPPQAPPQPTLVAPRTAEPIKTPAPLA